MNNTPISASAWNGPLGLSATEDMVWRELCGAVKDRSHPWRTPTLATVAMSNGCATADARTVVLREANRPERQLLIYTDGRSPKVTQLSRHPQGTLVMWSAALGWQLRCQVELSLSNDHADLAARWERLRSSPAAQDYLSPLPPGQVLHDSGSAPQAPGDGPHFAVISARISTMDWLSLQPEGHRRALFDLDRSCWLQP